MADEIINRVASSKLITIDLEDFYQEGDRILLDISQWLFEGLILREKDFRESLKKHNWQQYQGAYVALSCTTDAIVPSWAHLLITTYLSPFAKNTVVGSLELLETTIFQDIIANIDMSEYQDRFVVVKGCANKPIPPTASIQLVERLQPIVKSIMYGEACSTVPLFKRKH